jgi:hypothetical protein
MRTLLTRLVLRAAEYCDRNLITVPDIDEWGAAPVWVSPTIDPSLFNGGARRVAHPVGQPGTVDGDPRSSGPTLFTLIGSTSSGRQTTMTAGATSTV